MHIKVEFPTNKQQPTKISNKLRDKLIGNRQRNGLIKQTAKLVFTKQSKAKLILYSAEYLRYLIKVEVRLFQISFLLHFIPQRLNNIN